MFGSTGVHLPAGSASLQVGPLPPSPRPCAWPEAALPPRTLPFTCGCIREPVLPAGGIFAPLAKALCLACGSDPAKNDGSEKKMGAYVMTTCFQTSTISSAMFITAMAANPLVRPAASRAHGIPLHTAEQQLGSPEQQLGMCTKASRRSDDWPQGGLIQRVKLLTHVYAASTHVDLCLGGMLKNIIIISAGHGNSCTVLLLWTAAGGSDAH